MKYRFEIIYRNNYMRKASEFLKKCDLDIGEVGIKDVFIVKSDKELKIDALKELFKELFKSKELEIIHIEGGKVE